MPLDIPAERLATQTSRCRCSRRPARTRCTRRAPSGGANYGPIVLQPADRAAVRQRRSTARSNSRPSGAKGYFSAYDPTTGELKWQKIFDGFGQAGSVVTAGGLVFVGTGSNIAGYFFAFDAKTGELLWKFNTGAGVFSSPSVYMVNGEEFVDRRVGRRRTRPPRRRFDSQLRAAEAVSSGSAVHVATRSRPTAEALSAAVERTRRTPRARR